MATTAQILNTLELEARIYAPGDSEALIAEYIGPDGTTDYPKALGAMQARYSLLRELVHRTIGELREIAQPTPTEGRTADEVFGPLRQLEHPRVTETESEARRQEESRAALEEAEATRQEALYGM